MRHPPGQNLFGWSPDDPLGCSWADFWGGDCATANRWFGGSLTRSGAIILPFPWGQCMETTGDYVCWNNVDINYFLYGGRGNSSGGGSKSKSAYDTCISNFYKSPDGKVTQFLAPTSLIPGWNPGAWGNLKNWAEAIGTKYAVTEIAVAGSNSGQIVNYSLTAGSATASASELSGVVGAGLAGLGKIAPPLMVGATGKDILAHANCGVQSILPGPINVDLLDLVP